MWLLKATFFYLLLFFFLLKYITAQIIARASGKIREAAKPTFKLSLKAAEICPARNGPAKQPKSPAKARNPNIITPPFGILSLAILKEPGHIIPEPMPQRAQPKRERAGIGEKIVMR